MLPEVIAHRGASADRAEHTMGAYELALEQGADGLECDVRLTKDGHLVCVHDRRINRTSNGVGLVSDYTLDQLSELDFAGWHQNGAGAPPGVLTLEALLDLTTARPNTTLFVETKHPVRQAGLVEAKLVALLERFGLARPESTSDSKVVLMSFSQRAVRRCKQLAPAVPTVLLFAPRAPGRKDGELPGYADIAGPGIRLLRTDPDYVARAAQRGNPTYCWTVDEPADIALCQRLGVRYLATNRPARAREVLRAE
ncbi:glycerophosphodiester phosphodiesterase [Tamaricihabitans halophyticus]|uniref:glycerophosphodiester phosphodiesterase n=1 Tax=Tamaricihabitans halophyticus TaxID=1262583 RepID=UPI001A9FFF14|nr:glycerophosphodiester phosphodiesterase family protein [Tamaricihabitans halophyticus]